MRLPSRVVAPVLGLCLLTTACAAPRPDDTSLSEAVAAGDEARVRDLVEDGVDLDGPLVLGLTPLMRAVNRDEARIAHVLIEAGAEVDAPGLGGMTPLHIAARADAGDSLSLLLDAGADPARRSDNGMNALDHAADAGSVDVVDDLVAVVDIDQPSEAITQGHHYPRDQGPTPLGLAVREGNPATVENLLRLGAAVDGPSASGHTPLLLGVFFDTAPEVIGLLVEAGADLQATAVCARGCSIADEPLTVREWAIELGRERLLPLLSG